LREVFIDISRYVNGNVALEAGQFAKSKLYRYPTLQTSTHEYVTGAFMLASGEVYKLSPKDQEK